MGKAEVLENQCINDTQTPEDATNAKIPEQEAITMQDIPKLSIKLAEGNAMWRLESGDVELNAFTGKVSARLNDKLSDYDRISVITGLNCGNIVIADKVEDVDPIIMEVKDMLSQTHINARIMLDETKKDKFKKDMEGIRNINLLRACAEVERSEKNRKPFIEMIDKRLKELEN